MNARDKAYQVITDRILAALESGTVPWRKPWTLAPGQHPHNLDSKRPYSGINAFVLALSGFQDPRWITYKAAAKRGGHVRKNEKGTPVIFWKPLDRTIINADGEEEKKTYWLLKYYTLFNVEQIDGLDIPLVVDTEEFDPIKAAEDIVEGMPKRPLIQHNGADRAYYTPMEDTVHMPTKSSFAGAEEYYATLMHELGHSTGHESRLNRHQMETGIASFGSPVYSHEELAAEFCSAFVCAETGIQNTIENSAAYIDNWSKVLKKDIRLVVQAASQGQKAANYIIDKPE